MEEDIIKKIKEKIIEPFYDFPNPISIELKDTDVNLIENILNKLEELEKENAILRDNALHNDKVVDEIRFENLQLEKENKNLLFEYRKNGRVLFTSEAVGKYHIPKSKIEDKIKELERERKILKRQHIDLIKVYTPLDIVQAEILRLKELLEE